MRTRHGQLLLSGFCLIIACGDDGGGGSVETEGSSTGMTETAGTTGSSGTTAAVDTDTDTDGEVPTEPVDLDIDAYPFETLSEYHFFQGPLGDLVPNDGVISYTVAAPLWADAAEKGRYFVIPEGSSIGFTDQNEWDFPTGSVFIKNFYFDQDRGEAEDLLIVETRLLVLEGDGNWQSYGYIWNDEQTEADQTKAGADVYIDYLDEAGDPQSQLYLVPDQNVCESCHQRDDQTLILGPTTRQMNTTWPIGGQGEVNQIQWLLDNGFFGGEVPSVAELPALANPAGDASVEARARAYLHGNCAHCHRPGGAGGSSGLKFAVWVDDPAEYGVCKLPAAAGPGAGGRSYDIFPGSPEMSIVPFRMASEDPEVKMPELPSLLADDFGVQLIEAWITQMPEDPCE
ncbi:MAG: hypothetical protein KUG77_03075 [Nannocystaceae bacterium]|nr:hypothetical protein [Nannocystaceae bacterium]